MRLNLTKDILSVTDFKKNFKDTLDQLHKTHRPVVLTVNGKADAVVVDAGDFQQLNEELELARSIMRGEKEYSDGKGRPLKLFLKEFKSAHKI